MSWFDCVPLSGELRRRGVRDRDIGNIVSWWLVASKPGERMLLARYDGPNLIVDHDGNVTEATPPDTRHFTRTNSL